MNYDIPRNFGAISTLAVLYLIATFLVLTILAEVEHRGWRKLLYICFFCGIGGVLLLFIFGDFRFLFKMIATFGAILAFVASGSILFLTDQTEKLTRQRESIGMWIYGPSVLISIVIVLANVGALSKGETSPFPWDTFRACLPRGGIWAATLSASALITAELWLFLIPGHLLARHLGAKKANRPISPYIINILVGLLLCMPWFLLSDYWRTFVNPAA